MIESALVTLLRIIVYLVLIRVIISWLPIDKNNKFIQFIYQVTEPVLAPVRKMILNSAIGKNMQIDFSPIIVMLIIDFLLIPIIRSLF